MNGLAVIVVAYDSTDLLRHNLVQVHQALAAAEDPRLAQARVVVVDNWSNGQARRSITELADQQRWTLVAQPDNAGFGAAINIGVDTARTLGADTFLLLNPDAHIDAASVGAMLEVVQDRPMTLVGPVITRSDGSLWSDGHDLHLHDGSTTATRKRTPDDENVVEWLTGACLLVSDRLWRALGGLDEDYFLYWEDIELSWRVHQVGGAVQVVRDAHAVHDEGGTHRGDHTGHSTTFTYYNVRNRLLFAARNLDEDTRRRWVRSSPAAARRVLMWSGRRAVLRRPELIRAAFRGTVDGLRLALRPTVTRQPAKRPAPARLRVLASFPEPRPTTNPYVVMLKDSLQARDDIELHTFTWRRAVTGRYDVFHAHWPEILVTSHTGPKTLVRQVLFLLMMCRFRANGTAIVRTLHNIELPSGISWRQKLLLRHFDRRTRMWIRLNAHTPTPEGLSALIPHGHYRDWFAGHRQYDAEPGRIAYVGLIRRYKAVDTLIEAFTTTRGSDTATSLYVGGRPSTPALAAQMCEAAGSDPRVELRLDFLTETELVEAVRRSSLVVQPAPEMHNSGTVLMALSLGRPVLVPDNPVNRDLIAEVGGGWITTFTPPLTGADLETALRNSPLSDGGATPAPHLPRREWAESARMHVQAYQETCAVTGSAPMRSTTADASDDTDSPEGKDVTGAEGTR